MTARPESRLTFDLDRDLAGARATVVANLHLVSSCVVLVSVCNNATAACQSLYAKFESSYQTFTATIELLLKFSTTSENHTLLKKSLKVVSPYLWHVNKYYQVQFLAKYTNGNNNTAFCPLCNHRH